MVRMIKHLLAFAALVFPFHVKAEGESAAQIHGISLNSSLTEIISGLGGGCSEALSEGTGTLVECEDGSFVVENGNIDKISFSCSLLGVCDDPKDLIFIRLSKKLGFPYDNSKVEHGRSCGTHVTGEEICVLGHDSSTNTEVFLKRNTLPPRAGTVDRETLRELQDEVQMVDELDRLCATMGLTAYNVMGLRQMNKPQSEVRRLIKRTSNVTPSPLLDVSLLIVSQAYDQPLWNTNENKEKAKQSYRNDVESMCYKTMGWKELQ